MSHWKLVFVSMVLAVACLSVAAIAGVGPGDQSTIEVATSGTLSLFCLPDGGGSVFADACLKGGSDGNVVSADATITLTLWLDGVYPTAYYPAEDIWLQWVDESTVFRCDGGTIADSATDGDGITTWSRALKLGGCSEGSCVVFANGQALSNPPPIPVQVNSPDINADGLVNLADVGLFAQDFYNPDTQYRSDFVHDDVMNVADVAKMAQSLGVSCP